MSEITRDKRARAQSRRWRPILVRVGAAVVLAAVIALVMAMNFDHPWSMDKVRAATADDGQILHIKLTGVEPDGSTFSSETWTYDQTASTEDYTFGPGKYRGITQTGDQAAKEESLDSDLCLRQVYDAGTDTIFERRDETSWGRQEMISRIADQANYQQTINDLVNFGKAREDGREQVDGQDAVRILWEPDLQQGEVDKTRVFLVDAETGRPLELRTTSAEGTRVLHFELYEKLPDTPQNLALTDLRAQHPGATVITDPAAVAEFLNKLYPPQGNE